MFEEARSLSELSEYIAVYNDYKENGEVSSKYFCTRTCAILNQLQAQDSQDYDDDFTFVPEDFNVLEPTEEETEKLDYVVKIMVGQILAEY